MALFACASRSFTTPGMAPRGIAFACDAAAHSLTTVDSYEGKGSLRSRSGVPAPCARVAGAQERRSGSVGYGYVTQYDGASCVAAWTPSRRRGCVHTKFVVPSTEWLCASNLVALGDQASHRAVYSSRILSSDFTLRFLHVQRSPPTCFANLGQARWKLCDTRNRSWRFRLVG